jgi:hypothetical protein
VGKRVALIVLNVSAQYVTEQGESTIRTVFALNVAGWGSHSLQHRYPQHLLGEKINQLVISIDPDEIKRVKLSDQRSELLKQICSKTVWLR